jgi:hypothetical protein
MQQELLTPVISIRRGDGPLIPLLSLYVYQHRLHVNITNYDVRTGLGFSLINDEVLVGAPRWDSNYSDRAFEVVDQNENPIFQLVRESDMSVYIDGFLRTPGLVIRLHGGANGSYFDSLREPEASAFIAPSNLLPKIFLYPRWRHPGEYAADSSKAACPPEEPRLFSLYDGLVIQLPAVDPAS